MIRANRFARIALRIARATKTQNKNAIEAVILNRVQDSSTAIELSTAGGH